MVAQHCLLAREVVILLLQVCVFLAPVFTPTKHADAQPLVEYEKKTATGRKTKIGGCHVIAYDMDSFVCSINTSFESILIMSNLLFA